MPDYVVVCADWGGQRSGLGDVRRKVFIEEQGVPEDMEWDADDAASLHFLALDGAGQPVGCARLLRDGHIGRMAVLPQWRGRGVGRALLDAAVRAAQARGDTVVRLSAQTHAAGFYARAGFVAEGEEYEEAGIPHVAMHRKLS
jgi:predicted GNAT family N-acyltransferase